MSSKLPVGGVLNESVMFGLHHWLTFLRFAWAPIVVLALLGAGLGALVLDFDVLASAADESDAAALQAFIEALRMPPAAAVGVGALFSLTAMFLLAGPYASIYRLVALGENKPGFIHLRTDGPAVRVFLALLILGAINLAVWAVALLAGQALSGKSVADGVRAFFEFMAIAAEAEDGDVDPSVVMPLFGRMGALWTGTLLSIVPLTYLSVKFMPFAPGSAVENRLILFKSFRMTFGHAWSIFGALIVFVGFLLIAGLILGLAIEILNLIGLWGAGRGGALAIFAGLLAFVAALAEMFFNVFSNTAQLALQGVIYRRLEKGQ